MLLHYRGPTIDKGQFFVVYMQSNLWKAFSILFPKGI